MTEINKELLSKIEKLREDMLHVVNDPYTNAYAKAYLHRSLFANAQAAQPASGVNSEVVKSYAKRLAEEKEYLIAKYIDEFKCSIDEIELNHQENIDGCRIWVAHKPKAAQPVNQELLEALKRTALGFEIILTSTEHGLMDCEINAAKRDLRYANEVISNAEAQQSNAGGK